MELSILLKRSSRIGQMIIQAMVVPMNETIKNFTVLCGVKIDVFSAI